MQLASRQSQDCVRERLDGYAEQADADALRSLADDLVAVIDLLDGQPPLRRAVSDPAVPDDQRAAITRAVFDGKLGGPTLDLLEVAARARWSAPDDLVGALENLCWQAVFASAEKSDALDEVEDELFRFGRILQREPALTVALTNPGLPLDRRQGVLDELIAAKVNPATKQLLDRAVTSPRTRTLDRTLGTLSQLAAVRRDRYVAFVRSAVALRPEQSERLASSLARIYRRDVVLQVEVDPDLVGGLVVQVGDEVITGSVAARLAEARRSIARP
ncbi:MAG: F0F1 ATP synthase subunit delta [Mycobacteriales bacterium]